MYNQHLRSGKLWTIFFSTAYLHKLFGILQHKKNSIYLFSHLYQYGVMYNYYILCIMIQYYLNLLWNCFSFDHWEFFHLVLVSFWYIPIISCFGFCFNSSLFSGTISYSRLSLCTSYPSSWINHFFKESWFPLLEDNIRNQNLGTGFACWYYYVIVSVPSQLTEQENTYVHICIYTTFCVQPYL